MSDSRQTDTLCERCSLLSFDDLAIGGEEVVGKDGVARLSLREAELRYHTEDWLEDPKSPANERDYGLVRLHWELDEILPDMPHLSRSSELGCAFCQALRKSLEETIMEKAKSHPIVDSLLRLEAYLSLVGEGLEGLVIRGYCNQASSLDVFETVFPIEADSGCCEWLGAQPARGPSYLDPTNIHKMRELLDHCTSTCHPRTPSSFLPTRLIDIGHDVSAVPRLVISSNIRHPQQVQYAALSYCWGTYRDAKSQFKTEQASLETRCSGLPCELMTATTNDAIALARAIGLRYLWIDALCIIQDDRDDWSHESSQMDLVYRHAFVTFCSLNSDSCHQSFLSRAPAIEVPFQSTIRQGVNGSYLIRLRPRTDDEMGRQWYAWDLALSKWSKRCWTFQESEMSTRLLLFGSLRMHFECARCQWHEGDEAPRDRPKSSLGVSDMIARFKEKGSSSSILYEYWDRLVDNYGPRLVTLDKDRLPALAGLARMIGEALQDQYLAGLWKGNLHYGLVWISTGDRLPHGLQAHILNIQERKYVAPSWSWAASPNVQMLDIRSRGTRLVEESTIVCVNTETESEDAYGQVSGGFLRICGKMARMPNWLRRTDGGTQWGHVWSYDPPKSDSDDTILWSYHPPGSYSDETILVFTDWLHQAKEAGLEVLVLMLLHRIEPRNGTEAPILIALLLHPADESGHYYRVGVIMAKGLDPYKEMRACFDDSQEETICII